MFRVMGSMMPYRDRAYAIYRKNFSEASAVGFLSAILFTVFSEPVKNFVDFGEKWMELSGLPYQMNIALLGFVAGYGTVKILLMLRLQIFCMLLNYQGWMFNPKSTTTKMWGLMLNFLRGNGNFPCFYFEPLLPRLPVPDLNATCDRFLASMKPLVSEEAFVHLLATTEEFRHKEGKVLHKYILQRYATKRNWLVDIWVDLAYLTWREPCAVNANCYALDCERKYTPTTNQLARMANLIYRVTRYCEMIVDETLEPQYLNDLIPLTMAGYKRLHATSRVPGVGMDHLETWKDLKHIVIVRKGVYFKLDIYAKDRDGRETLLTVQEIYPILQDIMDMAEDSKDFSPVGVFTANNRDVWAKVRDRMIQVEVNRQSIQDVESCIALFYLDEENPKTLEEEATFSMLGNGVNRWFDKCLQFIVYSNGRLGINAEHSAADATLPGRVWEYVLASEKYTENGDIEKVQKGKQRPLPVPQKLNWNMDGFEKDIELAMEGYKKLAATWDLKIVYNEFGKGLIKKKHMSPDGFIQMALQLAYYRLYNKIPKTYESASTRIYAEARTETIRPVSEMSVSWVKSMQNGRTTREQKILLLKKAIQYQTRVKNEAVCGMGWDRHLISMYAISKEMKMETPKLFQEKDFWMPDHMSTSQTPTRYTNLWTMENSCLGGGFAPTFKNGYGISYIIVGEDVILFHVSTNAECTETSSAKMSNAILDAMNDMRDLLS